jgi:hypothetical protein
MKRLLVCVLVLAACSTKKIEQCSIDSDCVNPTFPFCDVNGEYPASEGDTHVCTPVPADCPPERCGCTPGATTCSNNELDVCDVGGKSASKTSCDLGCATDGTHCLAFVPSNTLADALAMASGEPDADIPDADTIVTDGSISSDSGTPYPVKSILLAQSSGAGLRVFIAKSFKIHTALLRTGQEPIAVAFVASGPITIDGRIDATPYHGFGGPGDVSSNSACNGESGNFGGGGGGNATAGGNGSPLAQLPPHVGAAGGAARTDTYEPLIGGCAGGDEAGMSYVGRGGGALQFVSITSLTVAGTGIVDVGGGGGGDGAGGGAGGTVLLEAPIVTIDGGVTANGGAGGACGIEGSHSTPDAMPAAAVGGCAANGSMKFSGAGGTGLAAPTDGAKGEPDAGAGGGGAVGRLGIHTIDGTYAHAASAVLSAKISTSALQLK